MKLLSILIVVVVLTVLVLLAEIILKLASALAGLFIIGFVLFVAYVCWKMLRIICGTKKT